MKNIQWLHLTSSYYGQRKPVKSSSTSNGSTKSCEQRLHINAESWVDHIYCWVESDSQSDVLQAYLVSQFGGEDIFGARSFAVEFEVMQVDLSEDFLQLLVFSFGDIKPFVAYTLVAVRIQLFP